MPHWRELEAYQQFLGDYPKLGDKQHRQAFEKYVERMWTRPKTYEKFLQAYLEFSTPAKPVFRRLNSPKPPRTRKKRSSRRSRRSRSRRSRRRKSRRKKKK